uniref:Uncharacterized protein n=1 Tax=Romanomermis culicivorax TaxID=13658 RepID=A0A915L4Q8_ROMCU
MVKVLIFKSVQNKPTYCMHKFMSRSVVLHATVVQRKLLSSTGSSNVRITPLKNIRI